jgi:hypothetical protein
VIECLDLSGRCYCPATGTTYSDVPLDGGSPSHSRLNYPGYPDDNIKVWNAYSSLLHITIPAGVATVSTFRYGRPGSNSHIGKLLPENNGAAISYRRQRVTMRLQHGPKYTSRICLQGITRTCLFSMCSVTRHGGVQF